MNEQERFQLWGELQAIAYAILEIADEWWKIDPALEAGYTLDEPQHEADCPGDAPPQT